MTLDNVVLAHAIWVGVVVAALVIDHLTKDWKPRGRS